MSAIDALILFLTLLTGVYLYFLRTFAYWKRKGVPHAKASFPSGVLQGINRTTNIGGVLKKWYLQAADEPFYGLNFFYEPVLLLRDPELIKEVLIKEFSTFHDRGAAFNTKKDPLTNHLFALGGFKWRNLRMKLTPTFTSGKMKMMFNTMLISSDEMVAHLENPANLGEIVEMKELFAKYTINVISRCAFGLELDSFKNPDNKFQKLGAFLFNPGFVKSVFNALFLNFPKLMYYTPIRFIPKASSDFFISTVTDTMNYRKENNEKRNDFMQLLMQLKEKGRLEDDEAQTGLEQIDNDSKFTFHELAAQAFIFFVAGFEPASTSLQFCLFELARNTHIQLKLRREIELVLAKHNGKVTYEAIQEMTYLDQFVSEILRLYPAAQFLVRVTNKPCKLPKSDLLLEKEQKVFVSIMGLHMDPKFFHNPEEFDPERFSTENKQKIQPYTYMPFGDGPRQCIGMRFALLQIKLGVVQFVKNYRTELCDQSPAYPLQFNPKVFITALQGGVRLKVFKV